ncbi:AraC family transcriptional regulator [Proteiniphilum sp. X52]|uniref:helix-turn-helix domain-containing protein n=1 Tax=Proteiniphilum sp. X52 TaxID=2382159 RepID=UPI000F09F63C|nr:AraC family transcriptional regulator [Proteiniphilum sp. X52]RNC67045.1 AraC family transcriptional regulator [Proteiniphilum sp. X52]
MQTIEHSGIFLSHFSDETTSCVPAAKEHYLTFVHGGELEFELDGQRIFAHGGECVFLRRNHKVIYHKKPFENKPYKGVSIELSREVLRKYFSRLNKKTLPKTVSASEIDVLKIDVRPEISALFERIGPYYQSTPNETFCKAIIHDAIELLLQENPNFYPTLFDFSDPWKIDLIDFMEKNFTENLSMNDFARYTGRSLATFKRDFAKVSSLTPQKWLIQRRLKEAYYLIFSQKKRASQVYLEVGFKDISHFYRTFKKQYGVLPSV